MTIKPTIKIKTLGILKKKINTDIQKKSSKQLKKGCSHTVNGDDTNTHSNTLSGF